jgi:hypothetical protein
LVSRRFMFMAWPVVVCDGAHLANTLVAAACTVAGGGGGGVDSEAHVARGPPRL